MSSPRPKRRWTGWILCALVLIGLGLLAGTPGGRLQLFRLAFTLGSDETRIWAAGHMGRKSPEAALPVIFGLIEDLDRDAPFEINKDDPRVDIEGSLLAIGDLHAEQGVQKLSPRDALVEAAVQSCQNAMADLAAGAGATDESGAELLLRRPGLLDALLFGAASPQPAVRDFALCILGRLGADLPPESAVGRLDEALKSAAREDPEPFLRRRALFFLAAHKRVPLAFFLDRLDAEDALLMRGQVLQDLHERREASLKEAPKEQRARLYGALLKFWSERRRQVAAAARAVRGPALHPCWHMDEHELDSYGDEGLRLLFEWIRAHPEDEELACFLPEDESEADAALAKPALALLRRSAGSRHSARRLIRFLNTLGRPPVALLPIAGERLGEDSEAAKRCAVAILAAVLNDPRPLSAAQRAALGDLLVIALGEPALREPLFRLSWFGFSGRSALVVLLERPEAEAVLKKLTDDEDPRLSYAARCALGLRSSEPPAITPAALLSALETEETGPLEASTVMTIGFTTPMTGIKRVLADGIPEPLPAPWRTPSRLPAPWRTPSRSQAAIRELGPMIIPALVAELRGYEGEALDRVLPKLKAFNEEVLEQAAREPGILGDKAGACLEEEE